jgi:hypothetical protein
MQAAHRYIAFAVLGLALSAPAAIITSAAPQDDHRVYDRSHKDYHHWDANEDKAYHRYFDENHHEYREYGKLNKKDQNAYWAWRHDHPDEHR